MTDMLEKTFSAASELPDIEQNTLAGWELEETDSDRK